MTIKQLFDSRDNLVAFPAPAGGEEHVARAFAAETLDGGIRPDNLYHLGDGGAVFLEFQQLDFAGGKILRHHGARDNVQRVDLDGGKFQVAHHLGGVLEIFHGFAGEPDNHVRGDGESRRLAALDGILEFGEGMPAVDGGKRQVVCGLQADFHDNRLFAVEFREVGDLSRLRGSPGASLSRAPQFPCA